MANMKPQAYSVFIWLALWFSSVMAADVNYRSSDDRDRCNRTVDIYQAISSPAVTDKNRGKPLHCSYRIRVRPAREDWVVFVRFTRLRVGQTTGDRRQCTGGYVQVVDGYRDGNQTNREAPGFYCGEIDSPKTFISETPYVKIVFHVDVYDADFFLQFDANVEQQSEVHARYGQYPQLYPHRRGVPVPGTYCERMFQDCSPGRCFVQSPGFPGIYPRNLQCKYHISVRQSLVGLDLTTFDVDGLRCDNLLMCFPRPLTKHPDDCPFDYVRIHDGPSEESPVIVTLCGKGRLKSNIIASGSEMMVVFVTSPAGPFLNTGFHFKADSIYDAGEPEPLQLRNDSCTIEKQLTDNQPHVFASLRSWYPTNTTCFYRFTTTDSDVVHVEFLWFRVERVTLCEESLKIYDGLEPDPAAIIAKLCDMNRPRTEAPRSLYKSTGPFMLVEFTGRTGSLDGSSLSYGFEARRASLVSRGDASHHPPCSRTVTADNDLSGSFTVQWEDFRMSEGQSIACNYSFDARALPHGRVNVTLHAAFHKNVQDCEECQKAGSSRLEIHTEERNERVWCLCQMGGFSSHVISSVGGVMHVTLKLVGGSLRSPALKGQPLLQFGFIFFSEIRCGLGKVELDLQGSLAYPVQSDENGCVDCAPEPLYCNWRIPVFHDMDVAFRLQAFHFHANCSTDYILVNHVLMCQVPHRIRDHAVILQKQSVSDNDVTVEFRTSVAGASNFTLWWTQLKVLPTPSSSDPLVSLGKDCEFLCAASMTCIKRELVCNGVPNCPYPSPNLDLDHTRPDQAYSAADEDQNLCSAHQDNFKLFWWIIGFGVGACACITLCLIFSICRRCHSGRRRF